MNRATEAALAGTATLLAAWWWRRNPSPCPYGQRWVLELPRLATTRKRLCEVLNPAAGERILEVGPGIGYHSLPVAGWIEPAGELTVLDIQQEMLDHVMGRAARSGITNIKAIRGDATHLPFADGAFDAAYLVTVLGEVPDQDGALDELARVLKPGGRLVVGEEAPDPHFVTLGALRNGVEARGLKFERRSGWPLGYFARFSCP